MKPLTKELTAQAIKTAHSSCHTPDNPHCIHAESICDNGNLMNEVMEIAIKSALADDLDPMQGLIIEGIHIGYRMHQLQTETEAESQIRTEPNVTIN